MRKDNLFDTEPLPRKSESPLPPIDDPSPSPARTADGARTDASDPQMGRKGMRFARNVPLDRSYPDTENLMNPSPRLVSRRLLTRDEFQPATSLNLMAACWIQFMQHGWFSHSDDRNKKPDIHEVDDPLIVPLEKDDPWPAADPAPEEGAWDDGTTVEEFPTDAESFARVQMRRDRTAIPVARRPTRTRSRTGGTRHNSTEATRKRFASCARAWTARCGSRMTIN